MEATITRRINTTFPATLLDDLERYVPPRKRNQVIVAPRKPMCANSSCWPCSKRPLARGMMPATLKGRRRRTLTAGCGTSGHRRD